MPITLQDSIATEPLLEDEHIVYVKFIVPKALSTAALHEAICQAAYHGADLADIDLIDVEILQEARDGQ